MQSQEQTTYEKLFHLTNDLVCLASTDGFFKLVNPAFKTVLGWDEADMLSKTYFEFIHPDDWQDTKKEIQKLTTGIPTINFTIRFRTVDEQYKWFQWTVTPEPATGDLFAIGRHVSAEIEHKQLLQDSEQKFRAFFENAQGLMCLHDLKGRLIAVNPSSAGCLHYTVEELQQMSLFDIVPPEDHENLRAYLQEVRQQIHVKGIMRTRRRDGTIRIWLFNNILEKSAYGHAYVIGNALDITERHALESDLKRTKEMLEQTNRVAHIGAWDFNIPLQQITWSNMTRELYELPEDYQPSLETAGNFYKEGISREKIAIALEAAVTQGTPWDLELESITGKGNEIWVRTIGNAEFENGKCKRLYGALQDISPRKKTEKELALHQARLAAFVEHTPAAVAMLDSQLKYIAYSRRWLDEYRLNGEVLTGRSQYEVFPEISEEWKTILNNCLTGAVERKDEDLWRFPDRDYDQYIRWEVRPWFLQNGAIGGIIILTEDITTLCQQREELRVAKLQAEQANKTKSEFLANMSHEIRTPLNGIIGFTDLLLKMELSESQFQYLSIVNESANSLLNIINDILDFSKIEADKLELDIVKSDLPELSSQVSDLVKYQSERKEIEMLLNVSPELPRFIWVDNVRLKQILVNLLTNAVKFTERGEIELKITPVAAMDEEHMQLRFEVRDTGIGISPEHQQKIFQAFSQADISITKKYGGTGLGLNISNRLLGLMNSRLQLHSEPGKGSVFYFDMTVKAEHGEPLDHGNIDHIKHVLIVDDNANNCTIIEQMLLLKGIGSDKARNGFEALHRLAGGTRYDVLILDYHMPYMDGLETIRKIRENFYRQTDNSPMILLHSSSDDEAVLKACNELNVAYRLIKPIKSRDLYNALAGLYQKENRKAGRHAAHAWLLSQTGLKVLIAEDNKVNMLLARTIIEKVVPQVLVIEAWDGKMAVSACMIHQPDIILMDIQMPAMNGYEATAVIREQYSDAIPIIALTAGNVKGERERCLAAGMDDFLPKPFVEEAIVSLLEKWGRSAGADEHFDKSVLLRYIGEYETSSPLFQGVLAAALEDFKRIQHTLQTDTAPPFHTIGHMLYGSAATIGMLRLARLARTLENASDNDMATPVATLKEELAYCIKLVENMLV